MTTKYKKTFDDDLSISNKNLQKILKFYLFECPVPKKSVRGKKFSDYGIIGKSSFSKLKKKMFDSATLSLRKHYKPLDKSQLEQEFISALSITPPNEYCIFLKHDESTVMQSLFTAIRNAFAHGSFYVKKYGGVRIFFLSNFNGYLKAEIVLHEETLLKWIECIKKFS